MIVNTTVKTINAAIQAARRGDWILYHTGYLWIDRTKSRQISEVALAVRKRSNSRIWAKGEFGSGEVTMVARKLGEMQYEYYAVKL